MGMELVAGGGHCFFYPHHPYSAPNLSQFFPSLPFASEILGKHSSSDKD